jgi:hypothetical protein
MNNTLNLYNCEGCPVGNEEQNDVKNIFISERCFVCTRLKKLKEYHEALLSKESCKEMLSDCEVERLD